MVYKYRSKYDKILEHPAVVLDIETLPETHERLDGYNELFGEWNSKLSSDKKRKPSLHFFLSRVYCVGLMIHNYPDTATMFWGDDEEKVLRDTCNWLKENNIKSYIGYNTLRFDFPMLRFRGSRYDIKFDMLPKNQYVNTNFDIFDLIGGKWSPMLAKLEEFQWFYEGIGKKIGGEQVAELYQQGRCAEIVEHCRDDILLTDRVFNHVEGTLWQS
jgi:DNA polymerase elongation subunit (family B)